VLRLGRHWMIPVYIIYNSLMLIEKSYLQAVESRKIGKFCKGKMQKISCQMHGMRLILFVIKN
jgi:hypothetical protein